MDAWVQSQLGTMPQLRYVPVISNALPEDLWAGRTGFVHQAVLQDHADLSDYQVYACGAPIVVESAHKDFCSLAHLPDEEFYADAFTSEADKHPA
jgi:CDP-4-dehydro-6-deoxyglucose reductase